MPNMISNMILGLPWLCHFNPIINWQDHMPLTLVTAQTLLLSNNDAEANDCNIPLEYEEFRMLFQKNHA